jgi:hypothetical protein
MRTLVFTALAFIAAYGMLFGPIVIAVGFFTGPQILIPGIIHVLVGVLALLPIGIMLRKGRPELGRVSDDLSNPYAPPGDR